MFNGGNHYYQERLREELVKRVQKNPHYSLRSFAKVLGIGPSALSLILSGKRFISTKIINRIFQVLELTETEQKLFLESVLKEKQARGLTRISPAIRKKLTQAKVAPEQQGIGIGLDEFRIIADWYHYAILELTSCPDFSTDTKWIAKALSINEIEAKLAIDRLIKLELLEEKKGSYKKTNLKSDTKDKTKTSVFHRKRQKQILEKSIHSLEHDPIEERNHSSLTFCINPDRMEEAKAKIKKFMWEMSEFLMEEKQERVYELNVALFPLQTKTQEKIKTKNEEYV